MKPGVVTTPLVETGGISGCLTLKTVQICNKEPYAAVAFTLLNAA